MCYVGQYRVQRGVPRKSERLAHLTVSFSVSSRVSGTYVRSATSPIGWISGSSREKMGAAMRQADAKMLLRSQRSSLALSLRLARCRAAADGERAKWGRGVGGVDPRQHRRKVRQRRIEGDETSQSSRAHMSHRVIVPNENKLPRDLSIQRCEDDTDTLSRVRQGNFNTHMFMKSQINLRS